MKIAFASTRKVSIKSPFLEEKKIPTAHHVFFHILNNSNPHPMCFHVKKTFAFQKIFMKRAFYKSYLIN